MNANILSEEEIDILIRQMLNIGEAMYWAGAEISQIENTLRNIGYAYEAEHVNVFALTSSIVLTIEFPKRPAMTQSRRIRLRDSINLCKLQKLHILCEECMSESMPVTVLRERTLKILSDKASATYEFIGELLAASGFTLFFGGNFSDVLIACLGVVIIFFLQIKLKPLCSGLIYFNAITSTIVGLVICVLNRMLPGLHTDMIMIGDIMVLIPGIAITNSIRYTFSGDSISAMEKLLDSVLQALAIAIGFTIAILLMQHFIV